MGFVFCLPCVQPFKRGFFASVCTWRFEKELVSSVFINKSSPKSQNYSFTLILESWLEKRVLFFAARLVYVSLHPIRLFPLWLFSTVDEVLFLSCASVGVQFVYQTKKRALRSEVGTIQLFRFPNHL